jgi:hypothetical protein
MKLKPRGSAKIQHCWEHYIIHPRSNLAFPNLGFLFKYKKNGVSFNLLNFI